MIGLESTFPCQINRRPARSQWVCTPLHRASRRASGTAGTFPPQSSISSWCTISCSAYSISLSSSEQLSGDSEVKKQIIGQWNWIVGDTKLKNKSRQYELGSEKKTQQTKPYMYSKWRQRKVCEQPGSAWMWQGHWPESSEAVHMSVKQCFYQVVVKFKKCNLLTKYSTFTINLHIKRELNTKFCVSFCQCKFLLIFFSFSWHTILY